MKIKTRELTDIALDWAVATIEAPDLTPEALALFRLEGSNGLYSWSTNHSQGGPILERERITTTTIHDGDGLWGAYLDDGRDFICSLMTGHTQLVSGMRCFVASRLGNEVDIPDELLQLQRQAVSSIESGDAALSPREKPRGG